MGIFDLRGQTCNCFGTMPWRCHDAPKRLLWNENWAKARRAWRIKKRSWRSKDSEDWNRNNMDFFSSKDSFEPHCNCFKSVFSFWTGACKELFSPAIWGRYPIWRMKPPHSCAFWLNGSIENVYRNGWFQNQFVKGVQSSDKIRKSIHLSS